jgi:nitroreductase
MDSYQLLLSLRAVRHFTSQVIPDEEIARILQAARWTGSAKNTQPWQFVIVKERQTLNELSFCGAYASHLSGAALGIILATPPGYALFDAGRVAQNMMLAAWMHGIGSCIASFQEEDRVQARLNIPMTFQAHTAISFGYPLADAPRTIEGQPMEKILVNMGRRPLDELVHWETW